jgi:hypothetical protein
MVCLSGRGEGLGQDSVRVLFALEQNPTRSLHATLGGDPIFLGFQFPFTRIRIGDHFKTKLLQNGMTHRNDVQARPLVEVDNSIPATYSLYPDVLDASEIGHLINCRDEHPRRERLFISIPLPIEIGNQYDRIAIGYRRF